MYDDASRNLEVSKQSLVIKNNIIIKERKIYGNNYRMP